MSLIHNLVSWLSTLEHVIPIPGDTTQITEWLESAEDIIDDHLKTDDRYAMQILDAYVRQHMLRINKLSSVAAVSPEQITHMDELCTRPQIEQRTEAWYRQMRSILGASELEDIFGTPRVRALLVMSKANPQPRPPQSLAVFSCRMSAFDWGIRFEPVVKQIYEHIYGAKIKELGRLISAADSRLTASPDGLVYSSTTGEKTGRLIEIKCPVTREPDGKISKKYYTQMQSQLFVTGIQTCDFVEAVFTSAYSADIHRCGPGQFYGEILLIETILLQGVQYSYAYGPVNHPEEFIPENLQPNQAIVERIPWRLHSWHEQIVTADPRWWAKVKPATELFWADVESAKAGIFVVPESTRVKKEKNCLIVIKGQ